MMAFSYVPYTAHEVALALGFTDCDDMTGKNIAQDMLLGKPRFNRRELVKLAAYKGVSVTYLTEHDQSFRRYADRETAVKRTIASRAVERHLGVEFAAEITGLTLDEIIMLKRT